MKSFATGLGIPGALGLLGFQRLDLALQVLHTAVEGVIRAPSVEGGEQCDRDTTPAHRAILLMGSTHESSYMDGYDDYAGTRKSPFACSVWTAKAVRGIGQARRRLALHIGEAKEYFNLHSPRCAGTRKAA